MKQALGSVIADFSMEGSNATGNHIDLNTFWFLHNLTYASQPSSEVDYFDNFRYRVGLERLNAELTALDTLKLQYERNLDPHSRTTPARGRSVSRNRKAVNEYSSSNPGLLTFGPGELFWEAAGVMEIADRDYIVFPESVTGNWTGISRPDGTAFRLGEVQNVLADIGFVPGGATLPEIELRAFLNQPKPKATNVGNALGVIEAKKSGSGADGHRELAHHRGGSEHKRAYLDFPAVDRGWLVCPSESNRLKKADKIGGVTWTSAGIEYFDPPDVNANHSEQDHWIGLATDIVLITVLRYQKFEQALADMIEECRKDPYRLYDVVDL